MACNSISVVVVVVEREKRPGEEIAKRK